MLAGGFDFPNEAEYECAKGQASKTRGRQPVLDFCKRGVDDKRNQCSPTQPGKKS